LAGGFSIAFARIQAGRRAGCLLESPTTLRITFENDGATRVDARDFAAH
jgi:hypothetical protein